MVRHLNGLLRPTEGRVLHDGADIAGERWLRWRRASGSCSRTPIARSSRARSGPRSNSGRGSSGGRRLRRGGRRRWRARGGRPERARSTRTRTTSGYSRRKLLTLASILAMDTPVVVLDEPTTGQDARGMARIQRVIADLTAAGRTVIAISHDMRFVAETFDRVVVMGAGRIVLDGPPGRGLRPERLAGTCLDVSRCRRWRLGSARDSGSARHRPRRRSSRRSALAADRAGRWGGGARLSRRQCVVDRAARDDQEQERRLDHVDAGDDQRDDQRQRLAERPARPGCRAPRRPGRPAARHG